jgi:hypothetical protein
MNEVQDHYIVQHTNILSTGFRHMTEELQVSKSGDVLFRGGGLWVFCSLIDMCLDV